MGGMMADTIVPTIVEMARERGAETDKDPKTILKALKLLDEVLEGKKQDDRKEA